MSTIKLRWVEKPGDEDQYVYVHSQEKTIWDIYNTIREIEVAFRVLKTDLSLKPIFHKKDQAVEAH